ncbi:MAG: hypothetical protein B7Z55_01835 [Planctomycetales bacterium 12-60-4]|nr:MAG: hypothetical protein B7Z55_01835 [Planctomycetales bacterium 12-60-4]
MESLFEKDLKMLTTSLLCCMAAVSQLDAPVSADAAVWRAKLAEHVIQDDADGAMEAVFAAPAALVNNEVVTAGEVLLRYGEYLKRAQAQLTPQEFGQLVHSIVARDLKVTIDRRLLVQAIENQSTEQERTTQRRHLDWLFNEQRLPELARQLTDSELQLSEERLRLIREEFIRERAAMSYAYSSTVVGDRDGRSVNAAIAARIEALRNEADIQTAYRLPK